MKHKICVACLMCCWFLQCKTQKQVSYVFPETMTETDRVKFTQVCDRGHALYTMSCAGCHNVQSKRKSIIPDFTQDQMSRYDLKVARNLTHDSSQKFDGVTPEELSEIYLFLTYKPKSNVVLVLPEH
jgi:hypothetical protein